MLKLQQKVEVNTNLKGLEAHPNWEVSWNIWSG